MRDEDRFAAGCCLAAPLLLVVLVGFVRLAVEYPGPFFGTVIVCLGAAGWALIISEL